MFSLEQSIANWREQMLAAGIKTPVPLEELENHLREDVESQLRKGINVEQAFEMATQRIGRAKVLKVEFFRAKGFLGDNKSAWVNRILGVLWLAGYVMSLNTMCQWFISSHSRGASPSVAVLLMSVSSTLIYATGTIGSVLLFYGTKWGRRIIRTLALLFLIVCVAQILNFRMLATWRLWCGICAIFSLVTIWLLHPPKDANLKPTSAEA